ncbi:unnamed protein product [Gadus morhua 'NCC']
MGSLKGRIKSLQADTSNTDSALTRLVDFLAEKEHIIQRLKEQRFQDDQGKGEELVASGTMLEKLKVEHKMALEETAARNEAQSMDWFREREALKAQLSGLMKELEVNRQFQEGEEREHLIRKRNWLEVEKRRLDADCMELQFLERERQRIRFERPPEQYGIQREWVELRRQREQVELRWQQEQLRFGQIYRSRKRAYRVEECGNPSLAQHPWRPRGQVVEAVYHRFSTDGAIHMALFPS